MLKLFAIVQHAPRANCVILTDMQGLLNAALLGRAEKAARMTLQRALTPPATGYRFPAFAPHFQDYEPSGTDDNSMFL